MSHAGFQGTDESLNESYPKQSKAKWVNTFEPMKPGRDGYSLFHLNKARTALGKPNHFLGVMCHVLFML